MSHNGPTIQQCMNSKTGFEKMKITYLYCKGLNSYIDKIRNCPKPILKTCECEILTFFESNA